MLRHQFDDWNVVYSTRGVDRIIVYVLPRCLSRRVNLRGDSQKKVSHVFKCTRIGVNAISYTRDVDHTALVSRILKQRTLFSVSRCISGQASRCFLFRQFVRMRILLSTAVDDFMR